MGFMTKSSDFIELTLCFIFVLRLHRIKLNSLHVNYYNIITYCDEWLLIGNIFYLEIF